MSTGDEEKPAVETWPKVIQLKYPVTFGKTTITELEVRRGKVGDIKGMELGETVAADQLIQIAARLCGQPPKVIELLDAEDGEVMSIALDFYGRCLGAGKKP